LPYVVQYTELVINTIKLLIANFMRAMEGTVDSDPCAQIRDGIKSVAK